MESPIHRRFLELAGGSKARLLLCGVALDEPDETLGEYEDVYRNLKAAHVRKTVFADRSSGDQDDLLDALEKATGVFLTGGDQLRITSVMAGTSFGQLLRQRFENGDLVVGGTSAGAAAMASTMIIGGREGGTVRMVDVDLAPGLGYWRDTVVDTHFNQRGRVHRLLTVFAQNPEVLGIGLDEDAAVEVQPARELRVLGSGSVSIFDGRVDYSNAAQAAQDDVLVLSGVQVHVLASGFGFDLASSKLLPPQHDDGDGER